jgi:tetratricopeptide (TPR) repeat protein
LINLIEYQEVQMKRTSSKVIAILLALTFLVSASAALAQGGGICPPVQIKGDIESMLSRGYCLFISNNYKGAQAEFENVLKKDPGNPVALNDLAAVMVKVNKLDKADTYLKEALPRAKGYKILVNRVCGVQDICLAIEPYKVGGGNQDLGELVQMNINMVEAKMAAQKGGAGAGYPGMH